MKLAWIVFLFPVFVAAETVDNLHMNLSKDLKLTQNSKWTAYRRMKGPDFKIDFESSDEKKILYTYPGYIGALLLKTQAQRFGDRDFLITVWQQGNRTTFLRVFDPLDKQGEVYSEESQGMIRYEVVDNGLDVYFVRRDKEKLNFKPDQFNWQAVKK